MFVSNNPGPSENYSNDKEIIAEYEKLWDAFQNSKGSIQAAKELDSFVSTHYAAILKAMEDVGYAPAPQDQNAQNNLDALKTALDGYIQGKSPNPTIVDEWGNDVSCWMGIGITPEEVLEEFSQMMEAFQKTPDRYFAQAIQWILSPGYINTLSQFSQDPQKFLQLAKTAEADAIAYENDPSPANLQNLQQVLSELPPLLNKNWVLFPKPAGDRNLKNSKIESFIDLKDITIIAANLLINGYNKKILIISRKTFLIRCIRDLGASHTSYVVFCYLL